MPAPPLLSICMVSFNCRNVVEDCLVSLRQSTLQDFEIICADNGSTDGTLEYLRAQPDVKLIENGWNAGFTKGTNQAIAAGSGKYVLWLNTDTIIPSGALQKLIDFLEAHPRAGIAGPRVLNADGSFQPQCKRGLPTPFASLCYSLGLDRIWPGNPEVSRYLLRNIDEHQTAIVDAVSGCCLLTRRELVAAVGPLDEEMFGFGEDLDWCVRASKAGWEVWYVADVSITHLKGQGGAHARPYRKIRGMHGCMWLFYKKHLKSRYPFPMTAFVALGIAGSFLLQCTATFVSRLLK